VTRRLVIAMTTLVAVIALALAIPLGIAISNYERESFLGSLEFETLTTASVMSSQPYIDWQASADATADRTGARVVVVNSDLTLVADSDASGVDRAFDRPEIEAALAGELASDVRPSVTLGDDLRFVAAPIVQNFKVVAVVRLSLSESAVNSAVLTAELWLIAFVASVIFAAGLIAWFLSRSLARPVDSLTGVIELMPQDLSIRADEKHGTKEIRHAATAVNATAARLEGLLSRTQRVAADASHHLRSPLTGVRLRLEAISDLSKDPEITSNADAAIDEVDRLAHRIDQILLLTRSDSGMLNLRQESLSGIASDRIAAATVIAQEKGIVIRAELEDCTVTVSTGTCSRIIDELLGNALKYAESEVVVHLQRAGDFCELTVSDDGSGLPEGEDFAQIFERFYRASNSHPGGSGLGLALVQESARMAGGDAWAQEVSEGTGLRILVRLPVAS
jgi:signal transduction histidine kinase